MDTYDWIIGVCSTREDGVRLFRFRGNKNEVKEQLFSLINEDKEMDEEIWSYGCEKLEDICAVDNGLGYELYAYGVYLDYHIDYTAKEFAHIDFV